MQEIFVLSSFYHEDKRVFETIRRAAESQGLYAFRKDEIGGPGNLHQVIRKAIEDADLIIADLTDTPPGVMYELGFAHCMAKPVILMHEAAAQVIYDLRDVPALKYSRDAPFDDFRDKLEQLIGQAKTDPDRFRVIPPMPSHENRVFVSYSHKNKDALERLMVHLGPLQKQGKVDVWADTRLKAGDRWKDEIEEALRHCSVAVLLVSADFLYSDFILDNELPPLLKKAESDGCRIVPIILDHCRFTRDKNLSQFQAANEPAEPLASLEQTGREKVFRDVADLIEDVLDQSG